MEYQQKKYHMIAEEKPSTRIKNLDAIYKTYGELSSKLNAAIVAENTEIEPLQTKYNQLLDEIEQFVKTDKSYTINRILTNNKNHQLNAKYHLNIMRNNLVIAMSYAFEHSSKPASIKNNIKSLKHVDIKVTQNYYRTVLSLSSAIAQTSNEYRSVIVDKISKDGINTDMKYTVLDNTSFSDITFDSLQRGNYFIQGKLEFKERGKILVVPFSNEFEIK